MTTKQRNHATVRYNDDGIYKVVYHQTIVYKWTGTHQILNSGGYETVTTKQRINAELMGGGLVYQEKYVWYYRDPSWNTHLFTDGMKLNKTGYPETNSNRVINKNHYVLVMDYSPLLNDHFYCKTYNEASNMETTRRLKDALVFESLPEGFVDCYTAVKVKELK